MDSQAVFWAVGMALISLGALLGWIMTGPGEG